MGGGSYSSKDWGTYSSTRKLDDPKTKVDDIYTSRGMDPSLDPKGFKFRESVDSSDNPESTPIILGADITGSMDSVLDALMRKSLPLICAEIYDREAVSNPHICTVAIGDVEFNEQAPFQVTQFEADIRIFESLEKLFLERKGGGNGHESYTLAWYFAKFRTKTDSFVKRGRKGFIFTFGDEQITPVLSAANLKKYLGDSTERDYTASELFELVRDEWHVYHVIIRQGSDGHRPEVQESWAQVIGAERVIPLDDFTKLGETIVSLMEMHNGKSLRDVTATWDGSTAVVVGRALANVGELPVNLTKTLDSVL